MNIIGVDFSGAKSDRNTWLAQGSLSNTTLTLNECHPITRSELTDLLAELTDPTVAALDFPFSVPQGFADYWNPGATSMPELWATVETMELAEFVSLRDRYVADWGEAKRVADTYFPECYSCLHKANPNMVPMTFRGMQMLHRLWDSGCDVPPLIRPTKKRAVLLEAMPGAALKAFKLPYKGYKNGARALELRQKILDRLA